MLRTILYIHDKLNGGVEGPFGIEIKGLKGGVPQTHLRTRKSYREYMMVALVLLVLSTGLHIASLVVVAGGWWTYTLGWSLAVPFVFVISLVFLQSVTFVWHAKCLGCCPCFETIFDRFLEDDPVLFDNIASGELAVDLKVGLIYLQKHPEKQLNQLQIGF